MRFQYVFTKVGKIEQKYKFIFYRDGAGTFQNPITVHRA